MMGTKKIKFTEPLIMTVLCAPTTIAGIVKCFIAFSIIWIAIWKSESILKDKGSSPVRNRTWRKLLPFMATAILSLWFYARWVDSNKVAVLVRYMHLSVESFLMVVTVVLGGISCPLVDELICFAEAITRWLERKFHFFKAGLSAIALCIMLQYVQMQSSSVVSAVFHPGILLLLNVAVVLALNLAVVILLQRWKWVLRITSVFFTVWSVVNVYVIQYHGSPMFLSQLKNAGTAMEVLSGYSITPRAEAMACILIGVIEFLLCESIKESVAGARWKRMAFCGILLLVCCVPVWAYVSSSGSLVAWNWEVAVQTKGFFLCATDDVMHTVNPYHCPDGYDSSQIQAVHVKKREEAAGYPDVIVILNETFCDLDDYASIGADCDYLSDFYSVENAVYGHAVVPDIGGGTNDSEFELLTSKSMYLLNVEAPFNYVDFSKAESSIVQYVEALGYSTAGMHCKNGVTYSRHMAYPAIGFDEVLLGEAFFTQSMNGNRPWTDKDNFQDLIHYYERAGEEPQFLYMLTFQNHGGYEQNDDEQDTVHTTQDFGDLTDDVNEYLSSVALSAAAFRELTDYFSESDRPVIICMVGDHAPPFISELPAKEEWSEAEDSIAKRVVPYVIWSNFDADYSLYTEYVSMVDLMPFVVYAAGLPMTAFYQTILDLHERMPIRTSDGLCVGKDGAAGIYDGEDAYYELLKQYYFMEYHSLIGGSDYRAELFLPES